MKEFNSAIQRFLENYEKHKKYMAFLLVLSLLVSLAVPISLIMPAVSMTTSQSEESPVMNAAPIAMSNVDLSNSMNFGDHLTGAVFMQDPVMNDTSTYIKVKLSYQFNDNGGVNDTNPYIYYQLPSSITIDREYSGDVNDGTGYNNSMGTSKCGSYTIGTNGLIVIQFTDEYIQYLSQKGSLQGDITFEGSASRNGSDDKASIDFGNGTTIDVPFKSLKSGVTKYGTIQNNQDGNPKITWTVTVNNPQGLVDLNGYTLFDDNFSNVTVDPDGVGSWNGTTFTFNDNANNRETITFKYETDVTAEQLYSGEQISNTAVLYKKDGSFEDDATYPVNIEQMSNIIKDGGTDYSFNEGVNNRIKWTITLNNNYGMSLDGYKINDNMLADCTDWSISANDGGTAYMSTPDSNGNVTISGTTTSATITYYTEGAEYGQNISNKATVTYPGDKPGPTSNEKWVTYDNPYKLEKNGYYSYDTGEITWNLKAYVNDRNNHINLDGYEITDDVFENMTLEQIAGTISAAHAQWTELIPEYDYTNNRIVMKSKNGDNIEYAYITKSGSTLTFESKIADNNQFGLQSVEFKYTTDASYAGSDGTVKNENNGSTKIVNTASDNKSNTVSSNEVDITPRDNVTKKLLSNSSETTWSEKTDNDVRELEWQVDMTRDTGFQGEDKALVDVMSSNGGSHYITADQTKNISLNAKASEYGNTSELSSSDYEIKYYYNGTEIDMTSADARADKFEIVFKSTIDDAKYKHIQLKYKTTADVSDVEITSASFSNQAYYKDGTPSTGESFTFERRDPNDISKANISVEKKWENDNGSSHDPVEVRLLRKIGNNGTWNEVTATDVEGIENPVSLGNNGNWSYTWEDLPVEQLEESNGTYTGIPIYYKVEEITVIDDYTTSYENNDGFNFNGSITIKNTKNASFSKIGMKGSESLGTDGMLAVSELEKISIGDTEYYLFKWKIEKDTSSALTLIDTLPEGHIFCIEAGYVPRVGGNGWENELSNYSYGASNYTLNGDTVTFKMEQYATFVNYYTAIPVSEVTDGYVARNRIALQGGTPKISMITVSGTSTIVNDDILTKTYNEQGIPGAIGYYIDINPEGKELANGDELDITDIFKTVQFNNEYGDAVVDASLSSLTIYVLDSEGNQSKDPLSSNSYSYTVDYKPSTVKNFDITTDTSLESDWSGREYFYIRHWYHNNKDVNAVLKIIGGTPGATFACGSETLTYDEKGEAIYSGLIPESNTAMYIEGVTKENISLVSASYEEESVNSVAELHLTVPDETPLRIYYRYTITKDGNLPTINDTVVVSNSVSIDTGNVADSDSENNVEVKINESSASASAVGIPKIEKVNIGDYSIKNLDAEFRFEKYEDSKWQYAKTIVTQTETNGTITHKVTEWTDNISEAASISTSSDYNISLDQDMLYALEEIKSPAGYEDITQSPNRFYYFTYNSTLQNYPKTGPDGSSLDSSRISNISAGGSIEVTNNQLIKINAYKEWDSLVQGSAELTLYWSYTKSTTGFPATMYEVSGSNRTVDSSTPGQPLAQWMDLPNGKDGRPVYYYVKETAYTVNGIRYELKSDGTYEALDGTKGKYTPIYTGNAVNLNRPNESGNPVPSQVEIQNSAGLSVQKLWKQSDGSEMSKSEIPLDKIGFNLYGVKNGIETAAPIYTGELGAENSWSVSLTESDSGWNIPTGISLKDYTSFRIEEIPASGQTAIDLSVNLYGYVVSSTSNVNNGTGIITLTNRDSAPTIASITVNKQWGDGNENHIFDEITVKLYQTTNSNVTDLRSLLSGTVYDPPDPENKDQTISGTQKLNSSNNWTFSWSDLPRKSDSGSSYYYYVVETQTPEGYTAKYEDNGSSLNKVVTITNYKPGSLTINKQWMSDIGEEITDNLPENITLELWKRALSTFDDSGGSNSSGSSEAVTSQSAKIMVMGDSITQGWSTSGEFTGSYRKYAYYQLKAKYGYDVSMVGKYNWTQNYDFGDGSYTYDDGYVGVMGLTIEQLLTGIKEGGNYSNAVKEQKPDIVILFIGTNDIMNASDPSKAFTKLSVDEYESRYKEIIDEIYSQHSGTKLYIITPSPINADNANWLNSDYISDNITNCVQAIKNVADDYDSCKYIDINAYLSEQTDYSYLDDYCHPNEKGHKLIGDKIAEFIVTNYFNSTVINPAPLPSTEPINGVPDDLETNSDYEKVQDITLNVRDNWSATLNDLDANYVYYIREKDLNGWTVSYTSNGQVIGETDSKTITVTNTKTIPKTSLTLNKTWHDGGGADRPNVIFTLERSTDGRIWTAVDSPSFTWNIQSGNNWTGTYSQLYVYASDGVTPYYYRVVETMPNGSKYIADYSDNLDGIQAREVNNIGDIMITNTKTFSLKIVKLWADGKTHESDTITVNVHRTTDKSNVPDDMELIDEGVVTTSIGDTTTTSTTTTITITSSSTTTTNDKENVEIVTNVDSSNLRNIVYSFDAVSVGDTVIITYQNSGQWPEFRYYDSAGNSLGSQAYHPMSSDTVTLNVTSGVSETTIPAGTAKIEIYEGNAPGYVPIVKIFRSGTLTPSTTSTSATTTTNITTSTTTSSTITPQPSESSTDVVNVTKGSDKTTVINCDSTKELDSITGTIDFNSASSWVSVDIKIYESDAIYESYTIYWWNHSNYSDCSNITISETTGTFTFNVGKNVSKIEFSWNAGADYDGFDLSLNYSSSINSVSAQNLDYTPMMLYSARTVAIVADEPAEWQNDTLTIELKYIDTENWVKMIENLPVYDENGDQYYYWVEEINTVGFTPSYKFDDGDNSINNCISPVSPGDNPTATIKNTPKESSGTIMPSTGGGGTTWYKITGIAIMLVSAASYIFIRRCRSAAK